jgi:hypothetical protein
MHRRAGFFAFIIALIAAALLAGTNRSLGSSSGPIATGSFSGVPWRPEP